MALKVVHAQYRLAGAETKPLGAHHSGEDAADQAGARGHGDGADGLSASPALQRRFDAEVQPLRMRAGGDVEHDAAIGGVQLRLPRRSRGSRPAVPVRAHDGGGCLVAARFEARVSISGSSMRRAALRARRARGSKVVMTTQFLRPARSHRHPRLRSPSPRPMKPATG